MPPRLSLSLTHTETKQNETNNKYVEFSSARETNPILDPSAYASDSLIG